jgi:hypothetical protein
MNIGGRQIVQAKPGKPFITSFLDQENKPRKEVGIS